MGTFVSNPGLTEVAVVMDGILALIERHRKTGKVAISSSPRGGISIGKGYEGDCHRGGPERVPHPGPSGPRRPGLPKKAITYRLLGVPFRGSELRMSSFD